jgi:hypothetical protein
MQCSKLGARVAMILFDNFVGTRKQGRRQFDAKRPSGLEVHHESETPRRSACQT